MCGHTATTTTRKYLLAAGSSLWAVAGGAAVVGVVYTQYIAKYHNDSSPRGHTSEAEREERRGDDGISFPGCGDIFCLCYAANATILLIKRSAFCRNKTKKAESKSIS